MGINFNPRLNPNDSLEPHEIEAKVNQINAKTREQAERAYLTGGVPVSASQKAADHSAIQRQTAEGKKARRDANNWWKAKNIFSAKEEDLDNYSEDWD
ncbi:MAG TPA: hypothetical protein V6D48_22905 [Oculatellaceae cyanobacterium]